MNLDPLLERVDRGLRLLERIVAAVEVLAARPAEAANDADPELWDVHQVAAYLKCSPSKVKQHAASGKIPTVPGVGRQLRFDPAAVKRRAHGEPPDSSKVVHLDRNRG